MLEAFWSFCSILKSFYTILGAFGRFLGSLKSIEGFGVVVNHLKTYGG